MVQKYYILFFDEASKRNIRVVGFGGIFCDSEGNIVAKYVWGLGQATNDQVEDYALLWGILIASEKKIVSLKVIGDSMVIIKSRDYYGKNQKEGNLFHQNIFLPLQNMPQFCCRPMG